MPTFNQKNTENKSAFSLWLKNYTPRNRDELRNISDGKIRSFIETTFDTSLSSSDPAVQEFYEDVALIVKEEIPDLVDDIYIDFYLSENLENLSQSSCKTICIAMFTYLLSRYIASRNSFRNEEGELKLRLLVYNIINKDHIYDEKNRELFYTLFKSYKKEKKYTDKIEDINEYLGRKTHQHFSSYANIEFFKSIAGYLNGLMVIYWKANY